MRIVNRKIMKITSDLIIAKRENLILESQMLNGRKINVENIAATPVSILQTIRKNKRKNS
jgi:hypothetical protein